MKKHILKLAVLAAIVAAPAVAILLAQCSIKKNRGLMQGEELPRARLVTPGGCAVDTARWRGSPTLLVLFQSTCATCEIEIHNLERIAPSLPALRIALVSTDSAPPRAPTTFPVYLDPSGEFVRRTRKLAVPTVYWIDSSGRVAYARAGLLPSSREQILYQSLLSKEPVTTTNTASWAKTGAIE